MDVSKIEPFPNRVASRCSAKLSLASPACGVDKQTEINSRRVASCRTCVVWTGLEDNYLEMPQR